MSRKVEVDSGAKIPWTKILWIRREIEPLVDQDRHVRQVKFLISLSSRFTIGLLQLSVLPDLLL
jgi:hypothetical protein